MSKSKPTRGSRRKLDYDHYGQEYGGWSPEWDLEAPIPEVILEYAFARLGAVVLWLAKLGRTSWDSQRRLHGQNAATGVAVWILVVVVYLVW